MLAVTEMSIFDKIKHKAEKTGRAIEKTAKEAEKAVSNTAKTAVGETKNAALKVPEKAMNVAGEIQGLINKADKEINGIKDKALREIRDAQDQAQRGVVATGKKVSGDLEHTVVDKLPKLIGTALSGLASEAMKPGLKGAAVLAHSMCDEMDELKAEDAELVKAINQCGFKLKIKANVELLLTYQNFYTRAREMAAILDRAGNEGIKRPPARPDRLRRVYGTDDGSARRRRRGQFGFRSGRIGKPDGNPAQAVFTAGRSRAQRAWSA